MLLVYSWKLWKIRLFANSGLPVLNKQVVLYNRHNFEDPYDSVYSVSGNYFQKDGNAHFMALRVTINCFTLKNNYVDVAAIGVVSVAGAVELMVTKTMCVCVCVCVCTAALRSRSGRSIINGNWAIDRPGKYEGVGTMFTYRRPNEISSTAGESFLAEGPTNEILDVYVRNQSERSGVPHTQVHVYTVIRHFAQDHHSKAKFVFLETCESHPYTLLYTSSDNIFENFWIYVYIINI